MSIKRTLTREEAKFIEIYFATSNLSRSYKEAFGIDAPHRAIKLLDTPLIAKRLKKLRDQAKKVVSVSSADVIGKLHAMSSTTVFDILDPATGEIKEDIDRYTGLMVKSIKISSKQTEFGTDTTVQISLNDRTRVLELLGKSINMFKEQVDLNVTVSVSEQIKVATVSEDDVNNLLVAFQNTREDIEEFTPVDVEVADGIK